MPVVQFRLTIYALFQELLFFTNLGIFTACGISFPGIIAPWSNNIDALGTATYTFSTPIYAI
jgi:hypothetical protein